MLSTSCHPVFLSDKFIHSTVQQTLTDNMNVNRKTQRLFLGWSQFKWKTWSIQQVTTVQWDKWCSFIHLANVIYSEKAMAPHSSALAWKIPWTEEPGRLQSMGSLRVGHDWATSLSLSCTGEGYWYFSRQPWFQLVLLPARHFVWCILHIN